MRLEEIFREYSQDIKRAMTAFSRDGQTAEDAVQQAFLKGLENREMLEQMPERSAKAWLMCTARNALTDVKRRQSRLVYSLEAEPVYNAPDPLDGILLHGLLSELPDELSEIVKLRYYASMSSVQIGRKLDLPPATVRTKLRSALKMMKKKLEEA